MQRDEAYEVRGYCLKERKLAFTCYFKGIYLKMNEIVQNNNGDMFCIAY